MVKITSGHSGVLPESSDLKQIQQVVQTLEHYAIRSLDQISNRQPLLAQALKLPAEKHRLGREVLKALISFQETQGITIISLSLPEEIQTKFSKHESFHSRYLNPEIVGQEVAIQNLFLLVNAYLKTHNISTFDDLNKSHYKLGAALGLTREERRSGKEIAKALITLFRLVNQFPLTLNLPKDYCPIGHRPGLHPSLYFDPEICGTLTVQNRKQALVKYLLNHRIHFYADLNKQHAPLGSFLGLPMEERRNQRKLALALRKEFSELLPVREAINSEEK